MTKARSTNAQAGWLGRSGQHRIGQDRPPHHTGATPDVDMLLSRLGTVLSTARAGPRVAAHQDRQASLSVTIGNDGRILAHCFAGCAISDVLGAVGLALADLFPQAGRRIARRPTRAARSRTTGPMARRARRPGIRGQHRQHCGL